MALETIIGLEVHAQMNTKTKLFCGCDNDAFGKAPNTLVCPVCMGHPGTLPVPNDQAVRKGMQTSLALQCTVNAHNVFSRKNYFYPDLPAGYQISQYDLPLAEHGTVVFDGTEGATISCRIRRLHLENDAGKLMHRGEASLVDYNRAGTPLMEIVTEPDLRSAKDAVAFAQELRRILIAVRSSEADMFKGMMRFDASISLREEGSQELTPRVEIKNLNSFKSLEKALLYQEKQLRKQWEKEGPPEGEVTVGWIDDEEKTVLLRDKESAADYRYFPEPDIPPLAITDELLNEMKGMPVALPQETKQRYKEIGLKDDEVLMLIGNDTLHAMFDEIFAQTKDARRTSSLLLTQLTGFLHAANKPVQDGPDAKALLALVALIDDGSISKNASKEVLEEMVKSGRPAADIVKERGLTQVSDDGALEELVERAMKENTDAVAAFKSGKQAAFGVLVGWAMKESKGTANPKKVNEMLTKKLIT